ncbi:MULTISPECIES: GNAT family N-acetyltransferase [Saccharibacillus]|uniref:GNAT family N-acetyltransferase n=1 Tax=Saccharibacillus TaxID=456492 RepID=UPI00123BFE8B|nr:GNAT family protein [Saccharibacillus sp. WB 17]MWJ31398.1 GNAT family N-acetyltransferase [Saccharibacillus sp. WB 17]
MIILQPFERADFDELIRWSGDEAFLLQWSGPQFRFPLSEDQLEAYVQGANEPDVSDRLVYKAVDPSSGAVVGHVSLGAIDRYNRSGRVGKVLVFGDYRGRGYGSGILHEILRIGFDNLQLHRISLGVFDFNLSALRLYEQAGFVREGLIRDSRRHGDTYWNLIEMGMLESEWKNRE